MSPTAAPPLPAYLQEAQSIVASETSFSTFYITHKDALFGASIKVVRRYEDAEEVVNDSFRRFHRAVVTGAFRGDCSPISYMYLIVRHLSINRLARNWRKRYFGVVSLDDDSDTLESNGASLHHKLPSKELSPEEHLKMGELEEVCSEGISKLNARQKSLLDLRLGQRKSYRYISRTMDMPIGTVKSAIGRAREKLRIRCKEIVGIKDNGYDGVF